MGTPLTILVYEVREDTDGEQFNIPFAAIHRSQDGDMAYDAALEFCEDAQIVNGTYEGKPENHYNGTGAFVIALLSHLRDGGYEEYTTLVSPLDYVLVEDMTKPDTASVGDDELSLVIWCQDALINEGRVSHSGY